MPGPAIVLASTSRYRRELLARLRLPFTVVAPDIDESARAGERPADTALRLAQSKAGAVAARLPAAAVIGSDQVADLDGEPLGKPGGHDAALLQLRRMQGRTVVFHTAVAIAAGTQMFTELVPTTVRFRRLTDSQLQAYLHADQPYDCAGAAKIESLGTALVERVSSDDPSALIGLPLIAVVSLLQRFDIEVLPA